MTNLSQGDNSASRFADSIRQLYAGGSNNTGNVTLRPSQTTTVVSHQSCNPKSHISLMPLTLHALAAMSAITNFTAPSLAAPVPKIINLTRVLSVASGNVSYTGTGFQPSAIHFLAGLTGNASTPWASVGFSDGSLNSMLAPFLGTGPGNFMETVNAGVISDNATGTNFQSFVVASMDSNGFTLTWTKVGTPTSTAAVSALCLPPAPVLTPGSLTQGGGVYVSGRTTGSFTLTHQSNPASDQNFTYSIIGGA